MFPVVVGVAVQLESVFVEVECLIQCNYWMNFYGILNAQSPEAESYWFYWHETAAGWLIQIFTAPR